MSNAPSSITPGQTSLLPGTAAAAPAPPAPAIRIEMLSCPRYLAGAREMVATLSRRLGFDEIGACQIALAVDEALANVIRHGYQRREDQPIWMSIWEIPGDAASPPPAAAPPPRAPAAPPKPTPPPPAACGPNCGPACASGITIAAGVATGLRIVIEDLGRQTDPGDIKGRDLDDVRPGGLGVHIIREVMDEVVYEKRPGGGMRLTLVKRPRPTNDAAGPQGESNG